MNAGTWGMVCLVALYSCQASEEHEPAKEPASSSPPVTAADTGGASSGPPTKKQIDISFKDPDGIALLKRVVKQENALPIHKVGSESWREQMRIESVLEQDGFPVPERILRSGHGGYLIRNMKPEFRKLAARYPARGHGSEWVERWRAADHLEEDDLMKLPLRMLVKVIRIGSDDLDGSSVVYGVSTSAKKKVRLRFEWCGQDGTAAAQCGASPGFLRKQQCVTVFGFVSGTSTWYDKKHKPVPKRTPSAVKLDRSRPTLLEVFEVEQAEC